MGGIYRWQEMKSNVAANNAIVDAAVDFFDKPIRNGKECFQPRVARLHFLTYQPIQDVLRGGDSIDLKALKTEKSPLRLPPAMRMTSCFQWFRLL